MFCVSRMGGKLEKVKKIEYKNESSTFLWSKKRRQGRNEYLMRIILFLRFSVLPRLFVFPSFNLTYSDFGWSGKKSNKFVYVAFLTCGKVENW